MAKKARDTTHLRVRLDPIRLVKLERAAERNGRTLTGEILHRLDAYAAFNFETLGDLPDLVAAKVVAALKGEAK
jgi:hypothetical protein